MKLHAPLLFSLATATCATIALSPAEDEAAPLSLSRAFIDGTGPGWVALGKDDFEDVNGGADTWTWNEDGSIHCTGRPVGVVKSKKSYRNLEIVVEWRHLKLAGNSGVFVWASEKSLDNIKGRPGLPHGRLRLSDCLLKRIWLLQPQLRAQRGVRERRARRALRAGVPLFDRRHEWDLRAGQRHSL